MKHRSLVASSRSQAAAVLEASGFVVIDGVGPDEVQHVLGEFGKIDTFQNSWKYVVHVRDEVSSMYTARSFGRLFPHLDKYEWATPPDLVCLYGRRSDRDGQGVTHVCDMAPFLDSLGPADQARLREVPISYRADEGLQAVGIDHRHVGPALDLSDPDRPRFRFSYNYSVLPESDPGFADLWERTKSWFEANKQSVLLTEDTLLLWHNRLVLHSRDSFTDADRLLWRVYLSDR